MSASPLQGNQAPEPPRRGPVGRLPRLRRRCATLARILVYLLSLGMLCPHVFSPDDEE